LSSTWLSPRAAAAGLAGINAIANLVGGGAISLVGVIKESTGSFSLALLPLVLLTLAGAISVLWMTRQARTAAAVAPEPGRA
jgi:MFS-type transporter involved in bile tolerance (Atg22 family)